MIISCKSRESPENPPGKSPAVLAKQRKFHAYNIDAYVIIKCAKRLIITMEALIIMCYYIACFS